VDKSHLYFGDNLDVLREYVPTASVDLVYLDPPFNSNRAYNVIFARSERVADANQAQIQAFDDTWRWSPATEEQYHEMLMGAVPSRVADVVRALHTLLGENDALAYLVNMAPRLVELHRVLKPTGSLYLHCDPTMSHYLKVPLDAIFGAERFRGEITWLRTTTHNDAKRWSPNADIILYYARGQAVTWNPVHAMHSEDYVQAKYRHRDDDGRLYQLDNITSPNPAPTSPTNGTATSRPQTAGATPASG
jgi:site-specific DNA-methyltransferase (adenine-specific)